MAGTRHFRTVEPRYVRRLEWRWAPPNQAAFLLAAAFDRASDAMFRGRYPRAVARPRLLLCSHYGQKVYNMIVAFAKLTCQFKSDMSHSVFQSLFCGSDGVRP